MSPENAPNLFQTLRADLDQDRPAIDDGDCGIIVKLDGSFRLFSTGVENLKNDPSTFTEREHQQIRNGQILTAFCLALQNEQVMDVLLDLATTVIDDEKLQHIGKPN